MHVCIYIYIINMHSTHTLCKQKLLFWMWLITINRLTALIRIRLKIMSPESFIHCKKSAENVVVTWLRGRHETCLCSVFLWSRDNTRLLHLTNVCRKQKCYEMHYILWEHLLESTPQIWNMDFIQQIWYRLLLSDFEQIVLLRDCGEIWPGHVH